METRFGSIPELADLLAQAISDPKSLDESDLVEALRLTSFINYNKKSAFGRKLALDLFNQLRAKKRVV